jgi:hypothetical protein
LHAEIFEKALEMTLEKISVIDQKADKALVNTLKKHLMGVFLGAALYSSEATVKFLD